MLVPYYIYTKDGTAYHLQQQIFSAIKIAEAIKNIREKGEAWHIETVRPSRGEYTIYWEYVKKEVGLSHAIADGMNWVGSTFSCTQDEKPNCWSYFKLREYFGSALNPKERGFNYIFYLFMPLAYTIRGIIVLLVCRICCKKFCGKAEEKEKTD